MALHVVVGAGPTGRAAASLLAEEGEQVRLVSRSGSGPEVPGIERVRADAADADAMQEVARGAATILNCAMPPYNRWPYDFPPINRALLDAAAAAGGRYALVGNAYAYGPHPAAITEDQPLSPTTIKGRVRAAMWLDALADHEAGRVQVAEVRGSDYIGAGAFSIFSLLVAPAILSGAPASPPADLDAPHTWTCTDDVGRVLVALTRNDDAWGRAWHVPSNAPVSFRALTQRFAALTGVESYILTAMTPEALADAAREDPIANEFPEMQYLFQRPFVLDTAGTERELGVAPSSLDDALVAMADAIRAVALGEQSR
jgi:nucleoside-diphosphate-sugar epimerase